ncbi:centrosomal protein of 162 kDa isoform X2 [Silurus meridionalis]|uniref:centrosomal protein of 162 kDa isoform X2 n=1 Tax=Silurus meridionalis TaxID=175797 RepID=UPI001EEA72B3|nr:centrosomal protein of 162 kDa isoform X2 [Silurus meridionalis]
MPYQMTQQELDQQFEEFLKESISDDSDDLGSSSKRSSILDNLGKVPKKQPGKKSQMSVPWWQELEDSDETPGKALKRTFRKSLRKSQTIQEVEDETKEQCFHDEPKGEAVILSSLEPEDSLVLYGSVGMQTLNEKEEENARILDSYDSGAKPVTEDSRLIKDQESFSPSLVSPQRGKDVSLTEQSQSPDEERELGSVKDTAASPAYSDDFQDDTSDTEPEKKKPERCGMLAKVSLHDSLNFTDEAPSPALQPEKTKYPYSGTAQAADPGTTGMSHGQSGASDMEALQEVYRQITHSVDECEEQESEDCRSSASFSSSEIVKRTTQHASTTESDLPTAEELMHTIGPESGTRFGSGLEALRVADNGNLAALDAHQTFSLCSLSSITEEVKRLMQEQDNVSEVPRVASVARGKKTQSPGRCTTTAPLSSAPGKASVPFVRAKHADQKPLPKASTTSRNSNLAKPPSPLTQRKSQKQTFNRMSSLSQTYVKDPGLNVSSKPVASKHSAGFLQQRMAADGLNTGSPDQSDSNTQQAKQSKRVDENDGAAARGHDPQLEYSSLAPLAQTEREFLLREKQLLEQHSKKISGLKQKNYVLLSKLRSAEEAIKKQKWSFGEDSDPEKDKKLKLIRKEMKEQETIIQGYHLENEKLYLQMKTLEAQRKQNEEAMFAENQRLLSELAITKEQLNKSNNQKTWGNNIGSDIYGHSITELSAKLQAAQRTESQLQEENHRLQQEKQALQVDLQLMKREQDLAKAQVIWTSDDQRFELKLLEERHKEEVAVLKKRLQWYAENQEMLDKDAARLRSANAEIQRLTEQVEKLRIEVAKQANQQQKKVKERVAEAKRIQDLERQVKEMEGILRRRHPNSLPALMLVAAAAGGEKGGESHPCAAPQPLHSTTLLEKRIHRLEAELEDRDEEAKRSLRAMEQNFHRIKLQYEQQISDLEQRLAEQSLGCHKCSLNKSEIQSETQFHVVQELEQLKELHQNEVSTLKAEVATLKEQLLEFHSLAEPKNVSRHQKQTEAAHIGRIERMNQDLITKSRTIQELKRTVGRLQKERKSMLISPKVKPSSTTPKQAGKYPSFALPEIFPPTQDEKDYEPGIFSGSHISEVQQENERLRARQEQLEQQWLEERVSLQTAATHAHAELQRAQEQNLEQMALLKTKHQREIERLVAGHALEHSSSNVAQLTNQVKSQEVMMLHLREQVKELQRTKKALDLSKLREETLQNQLTKLLEELKQAKAAHSPELRHFASLENKIRTMELRYNQHEQELQQMIAQTRFMVEQEQHAEVTRWQRLAQGKSSELEAFRQELDAILDVLRELQKQGVVIPATQHFSAVGCIFQPLTS